MNKKSIAIFSLPVIVAALGYFVDIYDLLLFNIVRIPSLRSLGLSATDIDKKGELIIGIQMMGLLLGGIIWGIAGDKKGRLSVLFGSIILYSIANIANGFIQTVPQYAVARFIAGIGLAGELGAGITLVSELLKKEQRGIGTSMVAGIGLLGAVVAYFISREFAFSNKFAKQFGITEEVNPGKATMYAYIAISIGDVLAGLISQVLKSRKKALYIFYTMTIIMIAFYFMQSDKSTAASMYWIAAGLGFATGFWAIFVTMGAEQFGTNLRATAATTIPNMVRGSLPLMLLLFNGLQVSFTYLESGMITGAIVMIISIVAVIFTEETFHKELDYVEM